MATSMNQVFLLIQLLFSLGFAQTAAHSKCRFSPLYSQADIQANSTAFENDIFYWEGQFHQDNIGYNQQNGMTYDGVILNGSTGLANLSERHQFSAASKEALQIMVYTHAIAGDSRAARFVYPAAPGNAAAWAAAILTAKLKTYLAFNQSNPGYGGFLPWFLANDTHIKPTTDWVDRVPALDNGELFWAVYGLVEVLHGHQRPEFRQLGNSWEKWLNYTMKTAPQIFYLGNGQVCAVSTLEMTVAPNSPDQNYTCEGTALLNDPYEGELFTWWLYFFGSLGERDRDLLWEAKRPSLNSVSYIGSNVNTSSSYHNSQNYSGLPVLDPAPDLIDVQEGFWFSSHEQWKLLEMPYLDIPIVNRVFHNAERVRTCNSVIMGENAGMFASVNDVTDPKTGQIQGYISAAGIPSISNQTEQRLDVITPYAVFPTLMFNKSVGLAWYKNMLDAKGMQNSYGSSESARRDGTGISAFVSWDSKVTTLVALLGGVGDFVKTKMRRGGIYDEFVSVLKREYGRVFEVEMGGIKLAGENVELCWPNYKVPVVNVSDFSMCR